MAVNSFCGEFLLRLQSHADLHGEFLLVLHTLRWFMRGAPLACPRAGLYGSFSYMPSAGLLVEFLLHTPCWLLSLGSFSRKVYAGFFTYSKFLFYKTKRKNVKVNKNVHN